MRLPMFYKSIHRFFFNPAPNPTQLLKPDTAPSWANRLDCIHWRTWLLGLAVLTIAWILMALLSGHLFAAQSQPSLYYARFSIITYNGAVMESQLDLLPIAQDYRVENFKRFRISGMATNGESPNISSAAKSDALIQLLMAYGLKSVHGTRQLSNALAADYIRMHYEGVIRYPLQVIDAEITGSPATCRLVMEVDFSPLAFPDRWPLLSGRERIRRGLESFLHLFVPN